MVHAARKSSGKSKAQPSVLREPPAGLEGGPKGPERPRQRLCWGSHPFPTIALSSQAWLLRLPGTSGVWLVKEVWPGDRPAWDCPAEGAGPLGPCLLSTSGHRMHFRKEDRQDGPSPGRWWKRNPVQGWEPGLGARTREAGASPGRGTPHVPPLRPLAGGLCAAVLGRGRCTEWPWGSQAARSPSAGRDLGRRKEVEQGTERM